MGGFPSVFINPFQPLALWNRSQYRTGHDQSWSGIGMAASNIQTSHRRRFIARWLQIPARQNGPRATIWCGGEAIRKDSLKSDYLDTTETTTKVQNPFEKWIRRRNSARSQVLYRRRVNPCPGNCPRPDHRHWQCFDNHESICQWTQVTDLRSEDLYSNHRRLFSNSTYDSPPCTIRLPREVMYPIPFARSSTA